jgi:integrase
MASIRYHRGKYQVRVRRRDMRPLTKTFTLRKDALEWARFMEVKADRRDLPEDTKVLQTITLGDLVRRYRDEVTVLKKGRETETEFLNAFLRHTICARCISELGKQDFAEYRDERLAKIQPSSLRRQLDPIQNMFDVAKADWGLPIQANPVKALKFRAPSNARERRLNGSEWETLLNAAGAARNPYVIDVMRLAKETGMRRSEILRVESRDVDLERRTLHIPKTKNGHSRTIPLTREAVAILRQYQGEGQLFPITRNALRLAWERVRRRAGVKDFRFHDLRHETISSLFERGLTTPEVALISGHRDPRMLFRYAHAMRAHIIEKLDRDPEG